MDFNELVKQALKKKEPEGSAKEEAAETKAEEQAEQQQQIPDELMQQLALLYMLGRGRMLGPGFRNPLMPIGTRAALTGSPCELGAALQQAMNKNAGYWSEMAGPITSNVGPMALSALGLLATGIPLGLPISAAGLLGGLAAAPFTGRRTKEEQLERDKDFWKNLLIPGWGLYNMMKRKEHYMTEPENKKEEKSEKEENKEKNKGEEMKTKKAELILKLAEKLERKDRAHIARKNFAFKSKADNPKEKKESGNYPIHDIEHARAALRYGARFLSPGAYKKLKARVYAKYPSLRPDNKERKKEKKAEALNTLLAKIAQQQQQNTINNYTGQQLLDLVLNPNIGKSVGQPLGSVDGNELLNVVLNPNINDQNNLYGPYKPNTKYPNIQLAQVY